MSHLRDCIPSTRLWLSAVLAIAWVATASAQSSQPVWWPPTTTYGRPVAQPGFDFPPWARYSNCRPAPLAWGYDPFVNYGPPACDCDGYHSINCPGDFVAHRPEAWYAEATFAPLTIDHMDGYVVSRIGPTGTTVLTTDDLRPEFNAGMRMTFGRRVFGCYRVEGTFMSQYNWDDSVLVTRNTGGLSTFLSGFANPISATLDNATSVFISERSSFNTGEVNVRYWIDMPPGPLDVSFLVGARHMNLNELFNFTGVNAATTNNVTSNTTNNLWGVQVGIEFAQLITTRFWMDVDIKGGIFNNNANYTTTFLQNGANLFAPQTGTRDRTTWMGDISVTGNWQMTPWLTLKAGYQAIFLDGVATAQNQIRSPLVNLLPAPLNVPTDFGRLAIHGPVLGLMAYW